MNVESLAKAACVTAILAVMFLPASWAFIIAGLYFIFLVLAVDME